MERHLLALWRSLQKRTGLSLTAALIVLGSTVQAQNYCTPSFTNVGGFGMGVVTLTLGSISNNSGQPNSAIPYVNYTTQYNTSHSPGDVINFSALIGNGNNTQMSIYLDWNNDKTFAATERVNVSGVVNANTTYNGSFQVPISQQPGIYRMRVVGDYGTTPANSPCQLNYTGTVHDYTFVVKAAVLDILAFDATTNLEMGNNNLFVTVGNISPSQVVTTYDIGYRVDNGTSVTESLISQSLASGAFVTKNFSAPLNMTVPGIYTLKIWARNPNSGGAGIDANDTIYRTIEVCNSISGAYTINPGGSGSNNFTSFNAAITKLVTCGINGPITFTVAPGVYNEQFLIPAIDGSSAANTITFDGVSAATRTISFNTVDANNRHVIRIEGTKYIEFRNFTIFASGNTYSWPVHIKSNSQYVRFAKNIIRSYDYNNATASTNMIPVVISGSNTSYSSGATETNNISIDSNTISGGYFNVVAYGTGTAGNMYDIRIRNNTMDNFYYYGLYAVSFINLHFKDNKITQRSSTAGAGYGAFLSSITASGPYTTVITGNEILRSYQYGFYLTSVNNNSLRGLFANNIGGLGQTNINSYGVYVNSCSNFDFWHNTISNPAATTNAESAAFYMTGSSNADVRNNIFHAGSVGSTSYAVNITTPSALSVFDYNNYYKAGADKSTPIIKLGTNFITGNDLKGGQGFNQNSANEAPLFLSQTNHRLASIAMSPFGAGGLGVQTDIDGDSRCTLFPTMGADESAFTSTGVAQIFANDTLFVNSPAKFYNSAAPGEPKQHLWTIDNGLATFSTLHIEYTFDQTGTYEVYLETNSCDGASTTSKTVVVINPPTPPVSAFIATANNVDQSYPLQFVDQSTGGPSSWVWTVTPSNGVQFVNGANVQNPSVIFNQIGTYQVCLIASNAAGQGNQVCRNAYIQVTETVNLCGGKTVTRTEKGKIFDQGGRFGDYLNGANCGLLIDPCASSVTLKFTSFNLDQGDLLKVYDGADENGTPLHTGAGFSGTIIPADLTASTGKMYVVFSSNPSNTRSGFEAAWTSTSKTFNAPIAAFRAPDTLYTGTNFTFVSNSTGTDATITWDFNNDAIEDANGEIASYMFISPGTYLVRLAITDCGGTDGAVKSIIVINPTAKPKPDFVSDVKTITPGQTVRFYDRTTQAPFAWEWKITPSTYTFQSGTDAFSQNPIIKFNAVGNYTINLIATNIFGKDSATKVAAIRVVEYCYPGAGLNSDLGITRVTFAGIDHVSLVGPQTYSDYSVSVKSASVQKGTKYPITIQRASNNEDMTRKVWIDFNGDGIFGSNEEVASHAPDKSISWTDSIEIPVSVSEGSTRMRIGTGYGITKNAPCGVNPYGEFEDYTITIYENLTRPVITLLGLPVVSIEVGSSYVDAGATATDDLDGNLTANLISSTNLNVQLVGTYYYRYNVSDNNGNSSEVNRIIHITPDITPPVLTLLGNNPYNLVLGTPFVDPGADAVDSYDGVIPFNEIQITGFVNSFQIGQYVLTYTVSDQAGNTATDQRTIIVGDTSIPVIYLKGADTVYLPLGDAFNDPGAIVVDNNSANLPYFVDLSVIDEQVVGNYTLVYTAIDSSGNAAMPVKRVVGVRDFIAPQLTLLGDTVKMEVNTPYNEPGYTVSDNYDQNVSVQISGSVDNTTTGLYLLIYTATDASGNISTIRYRLVQVRDTKAPVIVLNGDKILTLCRWADYTDPGYTVSDNYDASVVVEIENELTTAWEGLYTIRYTAQDDAGNDANPAERLIRVISCVNGVEDVNASELTVYPNPNNGSFILKSTAPFTSQPIIHIVDALGKNVAFLVNTDEKGISLELVNQVAGVYFVQVEIDGVLSTHKVQVIK